MDIDKDGTVTGNEGRVEKKEKSGKKKHKYPMVLDDDKRHVENQKKRKRKGKEEKKDKKELEMRNKKKKENEEEEEQNDLVDANDETDAVEADDQDKKKKKKKKKEKKTKDGILTVDEEQKKIQKEKKKKTTIAKEEDNQEKKKKKKEKEKKTTAVDSSDPTKPKSKKVTFSDKLKVFPPSDEKSTSSMKKGDDGYVRGKRFTPEEDEAIKNAIYEYIEERKLGEKGVEMVLNCSKYKLRDCWQEIRKALPNRPYESIYLRAHTLFERDSVRKWSQEELDLVRQYREKHGSNWALMAKEMGKFRHHVKEAWRRNRLENMKKGHWSQQEYQMMFDLVNKDLQMKVLEEKKKRHCMLRDNIGWEAISTKMETRATATCCRKWYSQLTSPMVAQGIWDDADDYRLLMALVDLDASCEDEVDWDCLLEHREGDVCRARWNQMWNHLGEHGNKTWSEQVDVLSKRYCPDLLEVREQVDKQREWVNL